MVIGIWQEEDIQDKIKQDRDEEKVERERGKNAEAV